MAWNEPGGSGDKDPWNTKRGNRGNQGPPDLDEVFKNLQKKFIEEAGDVGKKAQINQAFSSATKIVTSRELMGSMPKKQAMTEDKGLYTSYVLMVVNPKVVADALEEQMAAQKAVYARFRASEGFKELGQEIERYEAFKKEMNQMLNQ